MKKYQNTYKFFLKIRDHIEHLQTTYGQWKDQNKFNSIANVNADRVTWRTQAFHFAQFSGKPINSKIPLGNWQQ